MRTHRFHNWTSYSYRYDKLELCCNKQDANENTKLYAYQCNSSFQTGTIATRLRKGLSIESICDSPMVSEWKLQMMASAIFKYFWNDKAEVLRIADELLKQNIVNELHDDEKEKLEALQAQLEKTQKKLRQQSTINKI